MKITITRAQVEWALENTWKCSNRCPEGAHCYHIPECFEIEIPDEQEKRNKHKEECPECKAEEQEEKAGTSVGTDIPDGYTDTVKNEEKPQLPEKLGSVGCDHVGGPEQDCRFCKLEKGFNKLLDYLRREKEK